MSEIQIEKLDGLNRKVSIILPLSTIAQDKDRRLKDIAQKVKKPGFRPGKVPLPLIQKEYGYQVTFEAQYDKTSQIFFDLLKDKAIRIAGRPSMEPKSNLSEDLFGFDITFEVYPDFSLKPFNE